MLYPSKTFLTPENRKCVRRKNQLARLFRKNQPVRCFAFRLRNLNGNIERKKLCALKNKNHARKQKNSRPAAWLFFIDPTGGVWGGMFSSVSMFQNGTNHHRLTPRRQLLVFLFLLGEMRNHFARNVYFSPICPTEIF